MHDRILILAKSKLNSTETLVSKALIDLEIGLEEFIAFLRRKINMRLWKKCENVSEKQENTRLNSVNSKS